MASILKDILRVISWRRARSVSIPIIFSIIYLLHRHTMGGMAVEKIKLRARFEKLAYVGACGDKCAG